MGEMRNLNPQNPVSVRDFRQAHELFDGLVQKAYDRLKDILEDDEADPTHWLAAIKEVNNRRFGQAPSMQVIQGLVEHKHEFSLDTTRLSQERLVQLEQMLAVAVEEARTVDHEDE